jgi:D-alanine-D-alanine ligase
MKLDRCHAFPIINASRLPPIEVLCGGPGREADVSRKSGTAVQRALAATGCDARLVSVTGPVTAGALRRGALVFNVIHGTYGEDGTLQAELDAGGWSYVGSTAAASRLCMDKAATRDIAVAAGVPVAWGRVIAPGETGQPGSLGAPVGPLVLKPQADGSSVGLRMLDGAAAVPAAVAEVRAELGNIGLLLEERLAGPECTVAVIEDAAGTPVALTPIRIVPHAQVYDYEAKYLRNDTRYELLGDTEAALAAELQRLALALYRAAACRHFTRIDFMLGADGRPRLLEANTLPGFTDHSLVPKAAAAAGLDFTALCLHLAWQAAGAKVPT